MYDSTYFKVGVHLHGALNLLINQRAYVLGIVKNLTLTSKWVLLSLIESYGVLRFKGVWKTE